MIALAACSSAKQAPSAAPTPKAVGPASAAASATAPVDPQEYSGSIPEGKLLLNTQGNGNSSLAIKGTGTDGDFVIAVSCIGKGSLHAADKSGRLLLGVDTCEESPGAIYNSRGQLRAADSAVAIAASPGVHWRIAVFRAPHQ
ncbi:MULTISPECIES: hypothetical protein [Streptacidiphilus]|uniref:Lipoprotein n=1 Tax=Streptacidiphilus cavernicola TaxID=3342716 RepID=A0ABV6UNG6_9ACTN|nr:hypothetical protein [Streptacidiphilus jeojiense]